MGNDDGYYMFALIQLFYIWLFIFYGCVSALVIVIILTALVVIDVKDPKKGNENE